jgi:hypothetical protein
VSPRETAFDWQRFAAASAELRQRQSVMQAGCRAPRPSS